MDAVNQLVSPEVQALVLQGLMFLGLLMPFLEKLVKKTPNTVDDKIVAVLEKIVVLVPRVGFGGKKP